MSYIKHIPNQNIKVIYVVTIEQDILSGNIQERDNSVLLMTTKSMLEVGTMFTFDNFSMYPICLYVMPSYGVKQDSNYQWKMHARNFANAFEKLLK